MNKKPNSGLKIITVNRKASYNYFFKDIIEAGIVLKGSEIKSVRSGKINIAESYALKAREILNSFPKNNFNYALQKICNFVFNRKN